MRPLIIDCGANIGASCAYFGIRYPDALVIGLELAPENAKLAKENTEKFMNDTVLNQAIGPKSKVVGYTNPDLGTYDAFRVDENNVTDNPIPVVTMGEVLANNDGTVPFIAKIDIEGFEQQLFSESTGWMSEFELISVEIHDWMLPGQSISNSFVQAHASFKRDLYIHRDTLVSVKT